MLTPQNLYPNDDIWALACEEAEIQLISELGRNPTDSEIERLAEYLIESEPDLDAEIKDHSLDF